MISLSSCAGLKIKTWFLDGKQESSLIRRDPKTNAVQERMTFVEADGYRCYSEADDAIWRNRLDLCCAAAGTK